MRPSKNTGVMLLNEVALGKEYTITQDDPSLTEAPAGYDSVVARGTLEPGTVLPQFYLYSQTYLGSRSLTDFCVCLVCLTARAVWPSSTVTHEKHSLITCSRSCNFSKILVG